MEHDQEEVSIDAIVAAVGPAPHVQYNKPHVYPMAAPMFEKRPGIFRELPAEGPTELYVHVPFCSYRCSFCTYATRQGARGEQMDEYVRALRQELLWIPRGMPLLELYVGGGTPTVLPPSQLDTVLSAVWRQVESPVNAVHTVECSPESVTADHVRVLRDQQIGRVSMGIQSLDDAVLARLNRHHSSQTALAAVDLLLAGGLMLNVDLIYGLPGQTEESVASDFAAVASRGVHSVTMYNLRLNEQTPMAGKLESGDRLELRQLVEWRAMIRALAAECGFRQARWHTFVRQQPEPNPSHPARRFENLPAIGNQVGVGMSARSRLNSVVYRNHPEIQPYLQRIQEGLSPVDEVYVLEEDDRKALYIGQYLGNGRPLNRGHYQRQFGCSFDHDFAPLLPRLRESGLIAEDETAISLTETGKLVFDLVNWMFYPPKAREWLAGRQSASNPKRTRPDQTA